MTEAPYAPSRIRALPSWLLGRAAARGHRLVAEALAGVLSAVAELGPVSQADLSRTLGIDPKDMVAVVNDLQQRRLVARTPDPADRRKNAITISAEGADCLRRTQRLGDEANDELTGPLSAAEREQLVGLLRRIVEPEEPCG